MMCIKIKEKGCTKYIDINDQKKLKEHLDLGFEICRESNNTPIVKDFNANMKTVVSESLKSVMEEINGVLNKDKAVEEKQVENKPTNPVVTETKVENK